MMALPDALRNTILCGDVREKLRELPDESVHMVCTSPPYWSLRDYGVEPTIWGGEPGCEHDFTIPHVQQRGGVYASKMRWQHGEPSGNGHAILRAENPDVWGHPEVASGDSCSRCGAWRGALGLEPTLELYVEHIVTVMREVRRVMRKDGTLWLNLGDSYSGSGRGMNGDGSVGKAGKKQLTNAGSNLDFHDKRVEAGAIGRYWVKPPPGLKPKDLCGIPWRVALALQNDGWYLRSALPWVKRASMPESVTDRPSSALEYVFMLSRSAHYYADMHAVRKPQSGNTHARRKDGRRDVNEETAKVGNVTHLGWKDSYVEVEGGRNFRNADLWFESVAPPHGLVGVGDELVGLDVNTQPTSEAHFATFPEALVLPFVKIGTSEHGCCSECGAPWERVTQTEYVKSPVHGPGSVVGRHYETGANGWDGAGLPRLNKEVTTTGWRPTCKDEAPVVPCLVLDPFMGSGTVALVALRAARDYIGIELSPAYVAMAEQRIGILKNQGRLLL